MEINSKVKTQVWTVTELVMANGLPIVVNPRWVYALAPRIDKESGRPIIGATDVFLTIPGPGPNDAGLPGIMITVRGAYRDVAAILGFYNRDFVPLADAARSVGEVGS